MTFHEPPTLLNKKGKLVARKHSESLAKSDMKDTLRISFEDPKISEIYRKIEISDKIERNNGKDYTISATLKNFMDLLQNKPSKIKTTTEEIDHYVKLAIGWASDEPKEVKDVVQLVYDYAMDKRKTITPKFDTTPIDETIEWFSQFESEPFVTVKEGFISLRESLKEPWKFGLYEETQFGTPKQEINWEVKFSKQRFKKDAFGLSEKMEERLDKIKEYYK